jgi:hypothetical protein
LGCALPKAKIRVHPRPSAVHFTARAPVEKPERKPSACLYSLADHSPALFRPFLGFAPLQLPSLAANRQPLATISSCIPTKQW